MASDKKIPGPALTKPSQDRPKVREDTSAFLLRKNQYERPSIAIPGGEKYEFPLPTEGFTFSGTAALAVHRYIGDNAAEVQVMHNDEARIEISGVFPGHTSDRNMNALRDVLVKGTPNQGKILNLPGIFPRQQMVVMESYSFQHPEDERTDSIFYTVTFVRVGVGRKTPRNKLAPPPHGTTTYKKKTKGVGERIFIMRDNARTLRTMAKIVFKNGEKWRFIYNRNHTFIDHERIPSHQIPTHKWPIGTRFRY